MKYFRPDIYCKDLDIAFDKLFSEIPLINNLNVNDVFSKFVNIFTQVTNLHAPITKFSRRQLKLKSKPWITKGVFTSIRKKQKLYKSHFLSGISSSITYYKKYSNLLTKLKNVAKRLYYKERLANETIPLIQLGKFYMRLFLPKKIMMCLLALKVILNVIHLQKI